MGDRVEEIRARLKEWHNSPLDERQYTAYAKHGRLVDDLEYFIKLVDLMDEEVITRVEDAYLSQPLDQPLTLVPSQVDDIATLTVYARRLCRAT
jgi:hypothetical protein